MNQQDVRYPAMKRRLEKSLEKSGLTRAELIGALERKGVVVSQATISQWLSGSKRPDRDKMPLLAEVLKESVDWLEKGETGDRETRATTPQELELQRRLYRANCNWDFRAAPPDGGHDYGNPNLYAFKPGIGSLVRDAVQNINDAIDEDQVRNPNGGAEVTFRLHLLKGLSLRAYQQSLGWSVLRDHIEAATIKNTKLTRVLEAGLQEIDANNQLILLTIEDRRTTGLTGSETGEGNFAALCRNNLDSNKNTTAGGSFGLGKAVYTLCSQFATTLYHSTLTVPVEIDGVRREQARVIGRADLVWHSSQDGKEYAGPGWFGDVTNGRAVSVWENEALVRDLYLARIEDEENDSDNAMQEQHDDTGTSIQIVGFYDPSGETPSDIQQLGSRIEKEMCHHFWPALESGRLEARVVLYENGNLISQRQVVAETQCGALVDAYRRRRQGLTKPRKLGDVATAPIMLNIPAQKGKRGSEASHEALLIVRLDTPEDASSENRNKLALFRGNEMVVRYRPLLYHMASGTRPFHAILCCGTAAGDTDIDRKAEEFLRTAEPPAHDQWESNQDVTAQYVRGSGKALKDFFDAAARQVRELLRPPQNDTEEGPQYIRELLRTAGTGNGDKPVRPLPPKQPYILPASVRGGPDEYGRWRVEAEIRIPDGRQWRVRPGLLFEAESGPDVPADWQEVEPVEGCTRQDGNVLICSPSRHIRFRAISDPSTHPAPAGETAVKVILREATALPDGAEARSRENTMVGGE